MEFREIQDKLKEYYNVLKMARKPSREEFLTTTKVAVAVMFIVGLIGFAVYLLMDILPKVFK
ncbi:protein translocase SEC61 complex subunit gamma [Archaeoglobales archaeon]|nr:MAG: protein translocase SEC61 complex subunit gamma [Archaeoglobales archaeon]